MRWILASILSLFTTVTWAQRPTSTIRFSTTDQAPISVVINDRDYQRVGRSILIGDLPRKRHHIQIYQVGTDNRTGRNKGTTIYSGTIKLEPGKTYDAVLDKKSRNLRVFAVKNLPNLAVATVNENVASVPIKKSSDGLVATPVTALANTDIKVPVNFEANLSSSLMQLKKEMDKETLDKNKVEKAIIYAQKNNITAHDGRAMVSWLLFEEYKIDLAQKLKSIISDKQNAALLVDAFSFEKSKQEFLNSL